MDIIAELVLSPLFQVILILDQWLWPS